MEWAGASAGPLFSFVYTEPGAGERSIDSRRGWKLENWSAGPLTERGRELEIRLVNPAAQMAVELHAQCAAGYPVIRRWYRIENRSASRRVLVDASIISDSVQWADSTELFTYKFESYPTSGVGALLHAIPPEIGPVAAHGMEKPASNGDYSPITMLRSIRRLGDLLGLGLQRLLLFRHSPWRAAEFRLVLCSLPLAALRRKKGPALLPTGAGRKFPSA